MKVAKSNLTTLVYGSYIEIMSKHTRNAPIMDAKHSFGHCTMSSNAKFREMGPFSLKLDMKTLWTTLDLVKIASESFWKFGLLTLRPFGLWPLRPSWKFASANGCLIGGCTQNFIKIGQQMTDLHQFLCFSLGLLLSNFKGHLQANGE